MARTMRKRLIWVLVTALLSMAFAAPAQAGYVSYEYADGFAWITFDPLLTDRSDLRIQSLDGGATVIVEDRGAPITPGKPPGTATTSRVRPCETVSMHVARCTSPSSQATFESFVTDLSLNGAAKIRDLPGSGHLFYWITTGPAGDTIDLSHGALYSVRDLGGLNNSIHLGPHIGFSEGSYVGLGPGSSTVDVANGVFDRVECLRGEQTGITDQPDLGIGQHNALDTVTADPDDHVVDCD
jgi:hypothetical protein